MTCDPAPQAPSRGEVEKAVRYWERWFTGDAVSTIVRHLRSLRPADPTEVPEGFELVMEDDHPDVAAFRVPVQGEWYMPANGSGGALQRADFTVGSAIYGGQRFILRKKQPSAVEQVKKALADLEVECPTYVAARLVQKHPHLFHPDLVKEHRDHG